jgi:hypothetical protein
MSSTRDKRERGVDARCVAQYMAHCVVLWCGPLCGRAGVVYGGGLQGAVGEMLDAGDMICGVVFSRRKKVGDVPHTARWCW